MSIVVRRNDEEEVRRLVSQILALALHSGRAVETVDVAPF